MLLSCLSGMAGYIMVVEDFLDIALAQLVRRVREMRETRAAPTASVARMRRSTTVLDVLPRGEDLIDPLGLGYGDMLRD